MIRHPVLTLFGAVTLGCLMATAGAPRPWLWGCATGLSLALSIVAWKRGRGTWLAGLFCLLFCSAWSTSLQAVHRPGLSPPCSGQDKVWKGAVAGPISRRTRARAASSSIPERRVRLENLHQRCNNLWRAHPGRLDVLFVGGLPLRRGDTVMAELEVQPIEGRRNPSGPDPILRALQYQLAGRARSLKPHVLLEPGQGWLAKLDHWRQLTSENMEGWFPTPIAGLAKALALGDRGDLSPALRDRWAGAGIAHLLAISGLHVGLITGLIYFLLAFIIRFLPGSGERYSTHRIAAAITMPWAVVFCLWTGAHPSAVRATLMVLAYLMGRVVGRPNQGANALGIAGALILLYDPVSLWDASFLLSMGAVAVLLLIPQKPPAHSGKGRWVRYLKLSLISSLAVTLITAPITATVFGRIALVAPLSNLIAIPLATLIATPLAMALIVLGPLAEFIRLGLGWALTLALTGLDRIAGLAYRLPGASIDVPQPNLLEWITYGLLLGTLIAWRYWPPLRRMAWLTLLFALIAIGWRVHESTGDGKLHIYHPYVGQGDAAVVVFPEGSVLLFDAGGAIPPSDWDPGRFVVAPLLRRLGRRHIDIAVLSHPHPDHINGLVYVSQTFPIEQLWINGEGRDTPAMQEIIGNVVRNGGQIIEIERLSKTTEREGVQLSLLHPRPETLDPGFSHDPALSANNNSIVLRLQLGQRSILLPGDIERDIEQDLAPLLQPVDILKSPHHGSHTSSTADLLRSLKPRAIVVSCGYKNRFGFPHPDVLARYQEMDMAIFRTDRDGLVSMHTDGHTWQIDGYRGKHAILGSDQ